MRLYLHIFSKSPRSRRNCLPFSQCKDTRQLRGQCWNTGRDESASQVCSRLTEGGDDGQTNKSQAELQLVSPNSFYFLMHTTKRDTDWSQFSFANFEFSNKFQIQFSSLNFVAPVAKPIVSFLRSLLIFINRTKCLLFTHMLSFLSGTGANTQCPRLCHARCRMAQRRSCSGCFRAADGQVPAPISSGRLEGLM